jgi:uncharacterized membrane protein
VKEIFRLKPQLHWPTSLPVLLGIVTFALFFSSLAVQQHRAFLTNGLDLGNVDQALWNTAQGRFLRFTLMAPVESRLALHVEPILLLVVPFYWLDLGGPELLLGVQAIIVAIGAWPVYQLALSNYQLSMSHEQLASGELRPTPYPPRLVGLAALVFPFTYLMLPTLQSAILFDFHAVTLAPTFLLLAFLALEQKNNARFLVFTLLTMACKEDMSLVTAMLGLYIGLSQRRWRLAGLTMGLSLVWFIVAFFVIQPRFAAGGNIQLDRYAWLGENPGAMLWTAATQPTLVWGHLYQADLPGYLLMLLFPTAFLALFSPLTLLPLLPPLAVNLLSDNPFTWRLEDFHYGAPLAPFVWISTLYGIRRIGGWARAAQTIFLLSLLVLVFSSIYHYQRGFTPLARPFEWPQVTDHHQRLAALLKTIPADRAVFAQSNLAPHLSQRTTLYADLAYFTDPEFRAATQAVDDVLLDVTSLENIGGLHQFLQQTLLESGEYRLAVAQDGVLHLQAASPVGQVAASTVLLPPDFYTFSRPDSALEYPLQVDFGERIRLHGYSLHFNRQEEVQVTVDLELLQPSASLQPVLYLLDAQGQPVGATVDLPPTLAWRPVSQWPAGQKVRVRFNTLPWYTRQTPVYGLALGVMDGTEAWDMGRRLRPVLNRPAAWAVRLPAGGTLVQLARIEQSWGMPVGGPTPRQFTRPILPNIAQANFEGQLRLSGYTTPRLEPAQLSLTLAWQAINPSEALTRFVQLIGPDGLVYGQHDSIPDQGLYPTDQWQPGEVVVESVLVPIQVEWPAGPYTVHVGLYRPASGERLFLTSGGDHIEIPVLKK